MPDKTITFDDDELAALRTILSMAATNGKWYDAGRGLDIDAASSAIIKIGWDGVLPNGVMNVTALPVDDEVIDSTHA